MKYRGSSWMATVAIVAAATASSGPFAHAQSADAGFPGGAAGAIVNQGGAISPMGPLSTSSTGITGSPIMGSAMQNNLFTNPNSLPLLYGGLGGLTNSNGSTGLGGLTQSQSLGLMLLMNNSQAAGAAGPRMGTTPTGPTANSSQQRPQTASTSARSNSKTRGRTIQPGGLASRYFNRNHSSNPYPQTYYNRQTRYFP